MPAAWPTDDTMGSERNLRTKPCVKERVTESRAGVSDAHTHGAVIMPAEALRVANHSFNTKVKGCLVPWDSHLPRKVLPVRVCFLFPAPPLLTHFSAFTVAGPTGKVQPLELQGPELKRLLRPCECTHSLWGEARPSRPVLLLENWKAAPRTGYRLRGYPEGKHL